MRKKLIEVALPLEAINVASAREKSIRHGHPSTLHLWWARRPLAAARAVIFTSLVDDPDDPQAPPEFVAACRDLPRGKNAAANDTPRQRLFDFIERLVTWEATTDEKILNTARELILLSTDGNPPPLLDPFAGGGSIPLEAQRLGLEAHASDLNPVAVMINKALIEIPPKFANQPPVNPRDRAKVGGTSHWKGASGLAADVRYYGEWMREKAWERIGHLYPECNGETVIAWLWARTVPCPNPGCGAQMPLVRSFDLSKKKGKCAWVEPHVDSNTRQISFTVKQASKGSGPEGTIGRQGGRCLACGTPASFDHIRIEGQEGRMGAQLLAIVTEGTGGRYYHSPYEAQVKVALQAEPLWKPDIPINYNPRDIRPQLYGLETYADLFTPTTCRPYHLQRLGSRSPHQNPTGRRHCTYYRRHARRPHPLHDGGTGLLAYAEAVSVYLTFILDRVTDKSSSLAWWMNTAEKMAPTFSRHALPMVWDYAEMNPFCNVTSNFAASVEWVSKVIDYLPQSQLYGQVEQLDARHANMPAAIISTDPPYYDNIGYADLSDYMYIWMRRALRSVFPNTMGTMLVPKEPELIASPYRHDGDSTKAQRYFESGLREVFTRLRAFTSSEYPLTIYYAFKQQEITGQEGTASTGWETILAALMLSGFEITGTWPVRTERSGGLRNLNQNALASSIVLVCRPRPANASLIGRRDFVNTLRQELPAALREMQSGNIAPVDLAQASIGPGMAVYSRYSQVLEPDGSRLTVRAALQLINQVLDEFLAEAEGEMDGDSRFAIAWFEQYSFNPGEFGVADVLARAKNTSVDGLGSAGILAASAGKVRLYTWEELDPGWNPATDKRPTVWEAVHHLIERLNTHGESGAALLLAKMPSQLAANARQLAYRLYAICERKGWAEHARDYNALVISWSGAQEQATQARQSYRQSSLFD